MGCTDAGPTLDATSGMMFYVLAGDTAYEFFYRRIYDVRMCLEAERQYRKIVKGEKTIRLVGGHSLKPIVGPQPPSEERIPRRFTAVAKTMSQVFIRLQAGNRCKAYFLEDCELPKNYWAGMMPEPEKK